MARNKQKKIKHSVKAIGLLLSQASTANWCTCVKSFHVAVKEADVHAAQMDNVKKSCDDQPPNSQQHSHQYINWKEQIGQKEQTPPIEESKRYTL